MSVKVANWIFGLPLKAIPKFILIAIADNSDDFGECWPKVATIAGKSAQSERNVQKWLSMFEAWGLLEREKRKAYGRQSSNLIRLSVGMTPEALVEAIRKADERNKTEDFEASIFEPALAELRGDSYAPQAGKYDAENARGVTRGVSPESPPEPSDKPSTPLAPETAQDDAGPSYADFAATGYPNSFGDPLAEAEFDALSKRQRERAVAAVKPYRDSLGKTRPVTAKHFLKNRVFENPAYKPKPPDLQIFIAESSPQWLAWSVMRRLYDSRPLFALTVQQGVSGRHFPSEWPIMGQGLPLPPRQWEYGQVPAGWTAIKRGTRYWAAWQEWMRDAPRPAGWGEASPYDNHLEGWAFPNLWPPRKDGTFAPVEAVTPEEAKVRKQDEAYLHGGSL